MPAMCPRCRKPLPKVGVLVASPGACPVCGLVSNPHGQGSPPTVQCSDSASTLPLPPGNSESTKTVRTDVEGAGTQKPSPSEFTKMLAAPQAADELGRLGPYRVLSVLGRGGMGVVFLAEDPQLKRKVALKALPPEQARKSTARQRFLREARAAAAVEHDNIVPVFQVGEDRGIPFLAMPLLRGETLEQRLKREKRLRLHEALRIARETAQGLAAAHKLLLIHRDIKPGNLWLEAETGRVKILDFGLARPTDRESALTYPGAVLGTPAYMAPEQAVGQEADLRCDLFSLGAVLYGMCTGRPPFSGPDVASILAQVVAVVPQPPALIAPDVPAPVSNLVMWLLEKSAERRPPTAQVVVDELRRLEGVDVRLSSGVTPALPSPVMLTPVVLVPVSQLPDPAPEPAPEPTLAPPPQEPRPTRTPAGHPWKVVAVVLLFILLAGAAVMAVLMSQSRRGAKPTAPGRAAFVKHPAPAVVTIAGAGVRPIAATPRI